MAYETGTALSDIDLLDKLNTFLTTHQTLVDTGDNWTTLYRETTAATATTKERRGYAWSAPGATAGHSIYIACKTNNSIVNDSYNLYFSGGTFFNSAVAAQTKNTLDGLVNRNKAIGLFADNKPFTYWFFANNRRFIVVTKLTTVFSSCYCGFMLPSALPTEYPYPMVIAGGCDNELRRYSIVNEYFTSIINPRDEHFYLFTPSQEWTQYCGSRGSKTNLIYPRGIGYYSSCNDDVMSIITTSHGDYCPLFPVSIINITSDATQFWGALDGVYWVPGLSRAAEDTITTDDGRKFIVFQNGFRVTTLDFFAVEIN